MKLLDIKTIYTVLARLSKREKIILYAAVIFVSLTLLDRLIISPIASKMNSLDKQIQESESGIKRNLRILAQKDKILAEHAKYNSYVSSSGSEEEELTLILKEIESLANKGSVYLVEMKPAGIKSMGSSKKYLISLSCEAQMEQLTEFMYNIENSSKLLSVERYQISPKSKESSVVKCSLSIGKIVIP